MGLGEPGESGPLDALEQHVRGRHLLLVLDNFEHVEAAGPMISDLLRTSRGLKVLVTSRSPVRLYGESEYSVPPMSLPGPTGKGALAPHASDAVTLFAARARAVRRDFEVTERNTPAVHEICLRLDGLPLAVELAAARTRELSLGRMLAALAQRLDLASEGPRDVPARQQTLRATLAWSHDLLDEREQALFARLAVFAGGWTASAAATVAGGEEVVVRALVDKSLVVETSRSGEERYGMLETIREYAAEQLQAMADEDDVRQRHAEYFYGLAEQAESELSEGIDDPVTLDRLENEHDNLRAALGWVHATGQSDVELRFTAALKLFWWVRGHLAEGRRWLEGALERREEQPPATRAKALAAAGVLAYKQADYHRAEELWEEGLELYRSLGDSEGIARALAELGGVAAAEREYERATELYEESRDLYRGLGDVLSLGTVLANLGDIALNQGDYDAAAQRCEEALAVQRETDDKEGPAISLFNLSRAALGRGRDAEAAAFLGESLELARAIGYRELIAYCLEGVAGVAAASGSSPERAARIAGVAEALFDSLGLVPQVQELELQERALGQLRAQLGEEALARARAEGRQLDVERAIEDATSLARGLAHAAVK